MATKPRVNPLVVILGSTGTGKTKLSIELARQFDGEIISADSMQVYRDLDIVTAKATKEEQSAAPHHLLDVATPDQAFTVIHFREMALPIIDRLLEQDRMPIVVGGTNYYIESVLWKVLVGSGIREERARRRRSTSPAGTDESSGAAATDEIVNQQKRAKLATGYDTTASSSNDDQATSAAGPEAASGVRQCGVKVRIADQRRCVSDNNRVGVAKFEEKVEDTVESESARSKQAAENESEAKKVRNVESEEDVAAKTQGDTGVVGQEQAKEEAASVTDDEMEKVLLMTVEQMEQLESAMLHQVLRRVDPVTADRLHPNNKRKIIRALEVFQQDRTPLSHILEEQRSQQGGSNLGGPLRYRNVVIFWLRCEQETLNARLDARVNSMVAQGLLAEIRLFYERYVKPYEDNDFHRGILQSIGFKEFVVYLDKFDRDHDQLITDYTRQGGRKDCADSVPEGLPLLEKCLDNLKLVTQRYSKRQIKWINHRFLGNSRREVPPIFALDTTDVSKWEDNVFNPAKQVIEAVLAGEIPAKQPLPKLSSPREGLNEETSFRCETCRRTIVGEYQWQLHLRSNKHKKCLQSVSKAKRSKQS